MRCRAHRQVGNFASPASRTTPGLSIQDNAHANAGSERNEYQ